MLGRRPLVREAGKLRQLPAGDSMYGVPNVRLYLTGAVLQRIALDINGELPIKLNNASMTAVPVVSVFNG